MEFVDSSEVEETNGKTFVVESATTAAATPDHVRQAEVPRQERALTPNGTTEGEDSELEDDELRRSRVIGSLHQNGGEKKKESIDGSARLVGNPTSELLPSSVGKGGEHQQQQPEAKRVRKSASKPKPSKQEKKQETEEEDEDEEVEKSLVNIPFSLRRKIEYLTRKRLEKELAASIHADYLDHLHAVRHGKKRKPTPGASKKKVSSKQQQQEQKTL